MLKFDSAHDAVQYLANVSGKRVVIAADEGKLVFVLPHGRKRETAADYMLALVRWFMGGHRVVFVAHDDTEGESADPRSSATNSYVVLADSLEEAKRLARSELKHHENVLEIVASLKQATSNDLLAEHEDRRR